MKKFLFFFVALFITLGVSAQTQMMRVNKTDGTTLLIAVDEIESVDFPEIFNLSMSTQKWCLHPNQQLHLELLITEDGATMAINADKWETSDPAVATVDATGAVTGVGEGNATITARYEDGYATMFVKVSSEKVFDMSVTNITNTSCRYSIKPVDSSMRYYYNMRNVHGNYSIDAMDQHGSIEENVFYFTRDWYQFMAESYGDGRSWNDAMQPHLNQGPVSGDHSEFYTILDPGTEYALYAIAFDKDGYITAPIEMTTFETTAPEKSNNTFDIHIDKCLSTDAMFTVTPSNNDQYLVCVQSGPRYVEWFIENDKIEDMVQPMISQYATDSRYPSIHRGPATVKVSDFVTPRSNEDYYVIVFGYDDGQTTPVTLKRLRTESGWTEPEGEIIKVTPPANLSSFPCVINATDVYEDESGNEIHAAIEPMDGFIGAVGNDVYVEGIFGAISGEKMIKGTYNPANKTVTFPYPQQLQEFNFYGEGATMVYFVGGDLTTGKMCDVVFDYDEANLTLRQQSGPLIVVNGKPFSWDVYMTFADYTITLTKPLF